MKRAPHMGDAGDSSSTMHYLRAIEAAGTDDAKAVMAKMRKMPINDFFAKNGRIREDGRMVHDMYVYEVKKPSESKGEWDYYKLRAVIPGEEAFRSLKDSACPRMDGLPWCLDAVGAVPGMDVGAPVFHADDSALL